MAHEQPALSDVPQAQLYSTEQEGSSQRSEFNEHTGDTATVDRSHDTTAQRQAESDQEGEEYAEDAGKQCGGSWTRGYIPPCRNPTRGQ